MRLVGLSTLLSARSNLVRLSSFKLPMDTSLHAAITDTRKKRIIDKLFYKPLINKGFIGVYLPSLAWGYALG